MDGPIGWYASISGIIAALVIACDLGRRATAFGFDIFVTNPIAWIVSAAASDNASLLWQNGVLLLTNIWGVFRWLRRFKTEEGGASIMEIEP